MEAVDEGACLVLGASGTVGRYLTVRLRECDSEVLALSRRTVEKCDGHIRWISGDLYGDMPNLSEARVQSIYSVGPLDGLSTWLCAARLPSLQRVVALSSMSLEVKAHSSDPAERELATRLAIAERDVIDFCRRHDVACVVLRPTLIYGGGSDRSLSLLAEAGERWRVFPSIPGATGLRQPIHADDLAAACVAAMAIAGRLPKVIRVGGGEQLTFGAMLARTRRSLPGLTIPLWIPLRLARVLLRLLRWLPRWRHLDQGLVDRLQDDQIVDNALAIRELAWHPGKFEPGRSDTFLNK